MSVDGLVKSDILAARRILGVELERFVT